MNERLVEVKLEQVQIERERLDSAFKNDNWVEVEKAYRALQSVGEQLLCEHKDDFLQNTQGIAAKVAYALIQEGQLEEAVKALEQGAARLLSRAFADLTQLQQDSPELYKRYQQQLQAVNNARSSYQQVNTIFHFLGSHEQVRENEAKKAQTSSELQTAEKQFNKTLVEIRQLQGHENFLLIATDINTVKQVSQQPLIYIFSTEKGGYALSIFREEIQPIALPKLTEATLSKEMKSYFRIYSAYKTAREEYENTCTGHNKPDFRDELLISALKNFYESPCKRACDNYKKARDNWFNQIDVMTAWLYEAIMQPVLKACDEYKKACHDISHITLIPIGALNLLPLHAASDLTEDKECRYVLDDYTISYVPNALSLQKARNRAKIIPKKCLLIGNPEENLPACDTEIIAIQKYFDIPKKIERKQATKETVISELNNDYSVLHFSCHGEAHRGNPLEKTGLLMANNEMLTVQDFLNANLNARLVGLSACETGIIGEKLPDEVVGLPSSLLQAGAACVVSSLWSVDMYSTMFLMMKFYEFFKKDNKKPAIALREAQIWLRDATKDKLLGASTEHLKALRKHISSSPPPSLEEKEIERQLNQYKSDKPYEHAYYWAAFYVTGE